MRTLDPILAAGLAGGYGTPIIKLYGYNANDLTTPLTITYPHKFSMSRFTCKIWVNELTAGDVFVIKRGLKINGTEYLVDSPYWYLSKISLYKHPNNEERILDLKAWSEDTFQEKSAAADTSAKTVLENIIPTGCSAHVLTGQAWHGWQFEKTGTTITTFSLGETIPRLWSKYTARVFPRDNGYILFKTKITANEETPTSYNWLPDQITLNVYYAYAWNAFWENELGATHRISAYYPSAINLKLRNVGFIPSTANTLDIYTLHATSTNLNELNAVIPVDLSIEQGDYIKLPNMNNFTIFADVTETYHMGEKYPWQMKINGARMYYKG